MKSETSNVHDVNSFKSQRSIATSLTYTLPAKRSLSLTIGLGEGILFRFDCNSVAVYGLIKDIPTLFKFLQAVQTFAVNKDQQRQHLTGEIKTLLGSNSDGGRSFIKTAKTSDSEKIDLKKCEELFAELMKVPVIELLEQHPYYKYMPGNVYATKT